MTCVRSVATVGSTYQAAKVWDERLARNARTEEADRTTHTLFGIPDRLVIFLGLVIVERDGQVVEEGPDAQHLVLPERQPCEPGAGGRLCQTSPSTRTTAQCRRRIGGQPSGQQVGSVLGSKRENGFGAIVRNRFKSGADEGT